MSVFKIKSKISETTFKISAADLHVAYYISIKGTYCVFLMFFQICTATLADARA